MTRRDALAAPLAAAAPAGTVVIDPQPRFEISPYLYMQFMEPLGVTDSSVEACWDRETDDWRKDFIETVRDLAPDVIRWGGLYSRYYKWREGVGGVKNRPPARNYVWGGLETNRVGTAEFVDLCRRVGSEPLFCVNFLSDGQRRYHAEGRAGDAQEAADWVSFTRPYNVKLWQLGNETSYGDAGFTREETIHHTIEFARAMRARDASIQLIGWGDRGGKRDPGYWAPELLQRAGEHLDYVALHMMGQRPKRPDTVLRGLGYQRDPERAWQELLELADDVESRIAGFEPLVRPYAPRIGIAVTEGHLSLSPHNAHPILAEWLTAAYHARSLNIYQRHGELVRIATAADFAGNRWTVNAVTLQVPRGASYLMPVGAIARLFKKHNGRQAVAVRSAPSTLDIAAARTGGRFYLHVANLDYRRSIAVTFAIPGAQITGGRVLQIAPDDPREYASAEQPRVFDPKETLLTTPGWSFPPRAVAAVELEAGSIPG